MQNPSFSTPAPSRRMGPRRGPPNPPRPVQPGSTCAKYGAALGRRRFGRALARPVPAYPASGTCPSLQGPSMRKTSRLTSLALRGPLHGPIHPALRSELLHANPFQGDPLHWALGGLASQSNYPKRSSEVCRPSCLRLVRCPNHRPIGIPTTYGCNTPMISRTSPSWDASKHVSCHWATAAVAKPHTSVPPE